MESVLLPGWLNDLEAYGATPPQAAVDAQKLLTAAGDAALAPPSDDLRAQLAAGKLTSANVGQKVRIAALDAVARQGSQVLVRDLMAPIAKITTTAIRADASRLVGELRTQWDAAAKVVSTASKYFGPEDSAGDVILRGATAAASWQAVGGAAHVMTRISRLRATLTRDFGYGSVDVLDHPGVLYVTEAGDLDQLAATWSGQSGITTLASRGPQVGAPWLALVAAGWTLRLNTDLQASQVLDAGLAAQPIPATL
jgi:hypothetical protein